MSSIPSTRWHNLTVTTTPRAQLTPLTWSETSAALLRNGACRKCTRTMLTDRKQRTVTMESAESNCNDKDAIAHKWTNNQIKKKRKCIQVNLTDKQGRVKTWGDGASESYLRSTVRPNQRISMVTEEGKRKSKFWLTSTLTRHDVCEWVCMYACLLGPGFKRYLNLSLTLPGSGSKTQYPERSSCLKVLYLNSPAEMVRCIDPKGNPETNNLNQAHLTKFDVTWRP